MDSIFNRRYLGKKLGKVYKRKQPKRNMKKKGAIELSIGTIVIIVLAMSMLILGMVLIKNIFTGSNQNILSLNDKVKDKIGSMFVEDRKTVVYLTNQKADIKQNEDWGIPIAVMNTQKGTSESSTFSYEVTVADPDVRTKCNLGEKDIEKWIVARRTDSFKLGPGENSIRIVRFLIPDNGPLCTVSFNIEFKKDNAHYATDFFDIEVVA